ncbi:MAG TPA: replication-relaxation family protein [Patescibacteria group bacterium]|jgi:DNA-binding PadR family transcriptional regulator|nr:replication-relaxation family protein [Patescibacteria group bacterium]
MSKKIVTNKEKEIQTLIYTFRFINSKQIQQFLNHKDHRRINGWLKDLVKKGYLERDFKPIYGILTKPAVYNLTALGRKYIKHIYGYSTPKYLKRIARDSKASKSFKIRCQIIADWYLALFPSPKDTNGETKKNRKSQTETGIDILDYLINVLTTGKEEGEKGAGKIPLNKLQFFTPSYFPYFLLLGKIKPDAYLRRKTTKGIAHGLLFVLDAYIPKLLLRFTIKRIFDTLSDENWEEDSILSLSFFFLCPNNKIIIYLKRLLPSFLEKYYGSKKLAFHFATRNQLYNWKNGKTENIKWVTFVSTDY